MKKLWYMYSNREKTNAQKMFDQAQIGSDWPEIGQIWDYLRLVSFGTFWLGDLNKSQICPIWGPFDYEKAMIKIYPTLVGKYWNYLAILIIENIFVAFSE